MYKLIATNKLVDFFDSITTQKIVGLGLESIPRFGTVSKLYGCGRLKEIGNRKDEKEETEKERMRKKKQRKKE